MLYRRQPRKNTSIAVDLSPLIDVVFLLLIFFMVSTRFKDDQGLDLTLPGSESRQQAKDEYLTIFIDKSGIIRLAGEEVSESALSEKIAARLPEFKDKTVVLKVDQAVNHGRVVAVMDAAKKSGAKGLTFATATKAPPAEDGGP